jgi:hypothetical protein
MNQKQGSSLIMVMLVVAGIATLVFATQRLALVQFSQSNKEEDNVFAYQAARAAIEDGLLRYRFNRDVETAADSVFRYDLATAQYGQDSAGTPIEIPETTPLESNNGITYDPAHQYYDLKINYRTANSRLNLDADGSLDIPLASQVPLEVDDSILLTGFPDSLNDETVQDYYLRAVFELADPSCSNKDKAFVQLEQIQSSTSGTSLSSLRAVVDPVTGTYDSALNSENLRIVTSASTLVKTNTVRVRAYYCEVYYGFATATTQNATGTSNTAGPQFDSLKTIITATGYYGSAKRTLIAEVNRLTGVLIGIYDFNIYAGGNVQKTP